MGIMDCSVEQILRIQNYPSVTSLHVQMARSGIDQNRQEHVENTILLSNQKYGDSLDSLAFCLIFLQIFNETLVFNEKGRECYRLLHTPNVINLAICI